MRDVVIVCAGRTPLGKFGGMLKELTAVDLGSQAVKAALGRIPSYDPREIDELYMGVAEVALEHGVSREEQDEWAIQSHRRYFAALEQNRFSEEIQPVTVNLANGTTVQMEHDEAPRKDASLERLRSLPTVYGSKTVTAGNAPGLNDGASALQKGALKVEQTF
jgi:acetyl-CoA acetyltransferase